MWEISNINQLKAFVYSVILGGILNVVYILFFSVAKLTTKKIKKDVIDILFWILVTLPDFCFLLAVTNGEIRGYILIGEFFGFFIGYLVWWKKFNRFFLVIFRGYYNISRKVLSKSKNFLVKNIEFLKKYAKKFLKNLYNLLYNIKDKLHDEKK